MAHIAVVSYTCDFWHLIKYYIRCIKGVLRESYLAYTEVAYLNKLDNLKILHFENYFLINDLIVFHEVIHNSLPLLLYQRRSRTRFNNSNLNYRLIESVCTPKTTNIFVFYSFYVSLEYMGIDYLTK